MFSHCIYNMYFEEKTGALVFLHVGMQFYRVRKFKEGSSAVEKL